MLHLKRESDIERIERLKGAILFDYFEGGETGELQINESDLIFMLEKAEEQVSSEGGTSVNFW